MTDEERQKLCERLRLLPRVDFINAADDIEELAGEVEWLRTALRAATNRVKELERLRDKAKE